MAKVTINNKVLDRIENYVERNNDAIRSNVPGYDGNILNQKSFLYEAIDEYISNHPYPCDEGEFPIDCYSRFGEYEI